MKQIQIEQINSSELMALVRTAVSEAYNNHQEKEFEKMTFNIKETAKKLKRSENFIRKLVNQEIIKTTADGKFITGKELNKYLGSDKK